MKDFLITWTIDIEAKTAKEAARKAFEIMQEEGTIATVFEVKDKKSNKIKTIDLEDDFT